jgi:cytochrome c
MVKMHRRLSAYCAKATALATASLLLSGAAQANEALAQKNNCLGCHSVANKLVGPAYKDVAAKYAGQADAQARVMESIRNGSAGQWGDLPMPPHPKLSDADLKKLASWVLSIK